MGKGVAFLLMVGVGAVSLGQTSTDLSAKYRQITSYRLRPTALMTPRFAANGQVCEMVIERQQSTDTGIVFATSFSEEEIRQFVDELAPQAERGRDLTKHLNETVDGVFITTEYDYENVVVRVYGLTRPAPAGDKVMIITWPKRACTAEQRNLPTTP